MIKLVSTMMPTLRQIKKLNQLLLDLYVMKVPPSSIVFSEKEGKPRVGLIAEPIHEIQEARWYYIDWQGELEK